MPDAAYGIPDMFDDDGIPSGAYGFPDEDAGTADADEDGIPVNAYGLPDEK
jgi:hypothetical protein